MLKYKPSTYAFSVLKQGNILASGETAQHMFKRVTDTLFSIEKTWGINPALTAKNKELFSYLMAEKAISPGSPILTNAGRSKYKNSSLSSCAVIPADLHRKKEAAIKIRSYYRQNMGSGFDLTSYEDPVEILTWLNDLSVTETATGKYDRYIGNMGTLDVSHPRIREFIHIKKNKSLKHFNISVSVGEKFMEAASKNKQYKLADGTYLNARDLLWEMTECAHYNGDPGIIYLDRMNRDNPVEALNPYVSAPPCSEMGLAYGETCQFGYINLAKFAKIKGMDWEGLKQAVQVMTRALDNVVEISCKGYPDLQSLRLAKFERKIGVGICGLADALLIYELPYDSEKARQFARNVLSVINYTSKLESISLAQTRGSCEAMKIINGNKYYSGFLVRKYSKGTDMVSDKMWKDLDDYIKNNKMLRNIVTTTLPPTGRDSILMEATSSIEPIFGVSTKNGEVSACIKEFVERKAGKSTPKLLVEAIKNNSFQKTNLKGKECLKTAIEISPFDHMKMVAALVGRDGVYDESASKTVNLPQNATCKDVFDIFLFAHKLGLKNISVYRDGSYKNQPQKL